MAVLYDGVIAFLAAVGIAAILWVLADLILRRKENDVAAVVVLPVRGASAQLEHDVHALLFRLGQQTPVLLADCGLDAEGRKRAAIVEKKHPCVAVVTPPQVERYIT